MCVGTQERRTVEEAGAKRSLCISSQLPLERFQATTTTKATPIPDYDNDNNDHDADDDCDGCCKVRLKCEHSERERERHKTVSTAWPVHTN